MEVEKMRKKMFNALKLSGFLIRREYSSLIVDRFLDAGVDLESPSTFDEVIRKISISLENQCVSDQSIEREFIEQAIEVYLNQGYDRHETVFNVINAFDFPRLIYNFDRKQYFMDTNTSKLLADADVKAKVYIDRYTTILQRTKRNFEKKIIRGEAHLTLQTVDFLLTLSNVKLEETLILGSLTQVSEGKFFLEDTTGMVELDLAHAKFNSGFFCEQCIVLVNGYYEDRILHASTVIIPEGEEYEASMNMFGSINYFGGPSKHVLRNSNNLREEMDREKGRSILFFSDVWLDHPMVFEKLQTLFEGLRDIPPIAFVFMGNFMSTSHGSEMMMELRKLFKQFAELVLKYPELVDNSEFVFVPGLNDPCTPYVVPRFALPDLVISDIKRLLPKAIFPTNPCRLQYCTREIVLFRANLVAKFLQGTLHKPTTQETPYSVAKTIVGQGHLSPLPLNALTVHWDFDYCLRLYPLPDLVIVGDKFEPFNEICNECLVTNPGSFCASDFQFKSYTPFSNEIGDCEL